jgi:hypothetical protein
LLIFLPLVVGVAVLKHNDVATQESYLWIASAAALFVAPAIGGGVAGRRRPDAPLTHGAIAAGVAFVAYLAVRLVDGAITGRAPRALEMVLFLIWTVAMGVVGAFVGFRRGRTTASDGRVPGR